MIDIQDYFKNKSSRWWSRAFWPFPHWLEGEDEADEDEEVKDLVYGDDKPEESIDRPLIGALHGAYEPDDRPAAVQEVVGYVDYSEPPRREAEVEVGRDEGQGVGEAVLDDGEVQEPALGLVHGLELGLAQPVTNEVTEYQHLEDGEVGHCCLLWLGFSTYWLVS